MCLAPSPTPRSSGVKAVDFNPSPVVTNEPDIPEADDSHDQSLCLHWAVMAILGCFSKVSFSGRHAGHRRLRNYLSSDIGANGSELILEGVGGSFDDIFELEMAELQLALEKELGMDLLPSPKQGRIVEQEPITPAASKEGMQLMPLNWPAEL